MISRKLNKKSLVIASVAASPPRLRDPPRLRQLPRIADGWDSGGAKTAREISRGESPSYSQWRAWSALIPAIVTSPRSS